MLTLLINNNGKYKLTQRFHHEGNKALFFFCFVTLPAAECTKIRTEKVNLCNYASWEEGGGLLGKVKTFPTTEPLRNRWVSGKSDFSTCWNYLESWKLVLFYF